MKLTHPRTISLSPRSAVCCAGQVSLGICTLWFHVPIEIAAPHQVGSVITLSAFVWLLHTIRMVVPGARFIPIPPVK
jgi:heme A synthase